MIHTEGSIDFLRRVERVRNHDGDGASALDLHQAATIRDAPYLRSARTIEKSRLVLLPSLDVRGVFTVDNNFARAVVTELAQCYRSVVKNSKNIKLRTPIERLANYLIRQHGYNGGVGEFELQIEKRWLASYLGMTPENLSRSIKPLGTFGLSINGNTVKISDPSDPTVLAKPTRLIDDPRHQASVLPARHYCISNASARLFRLHGYLMRPPEAVVLEWKKDDCRAFCSVVPIKRRACAITLDTPSVPTGVRATRYRRIGNHGKKEL